MIEQTTAFILSGGEARRASGRNKSFLEVDGRLILEHQLDSLRPVFGDRICIVTDRATNYEPYGLRCIPDLPELDELEDLGDRGDSDARLPLKGIASALASGLSPWCFVLGCDMPWPSEQVVRAQLGWLSTATEKESPAPLGLCIRYASRLQPLHAIYHASLAASAKKRLAAEDRSLRRWIDTESRISVLDSTELGLADSAFDRCFENFNSPPDAPSN